MDRSLVLKASALARGTRKIPLLVDDDQADERDAKALVIVDDADEASELDVIDAEFVDVPAEIEPLAIAVASGPRVTPGRARRATDAYGLEPVARRPIIAIG